MHTDARKVMYNDIQDAVSTSELQVSVTWSNLATSTWIGRIEMSRAHAQWIGSLAINLLFVI